MKKATLGVTLIEMITVIVITGVIGTAVAIFVRRPVEEYVDATRRAQLTDIADTALRRITRDLRAALPNSIRITSSGGATYIEYLQTSGGGRYRGEPTGAGTGDVLDFTGADSQFDVIGAMPDFSGPGTRYIVVYNLNSDPAIATANAYGAANREAYASNNGTAITLAAAKQYPFSSPGKRFQVVQYPVTYQCDPAAGVLRRYWGYAPQLSPQPVPPGGGSNALLASNVSGCSFSYVTGGATQRTGVVALSLQLSQGGETVRLFQQVQVSNVRAYYAARAGIEWGAYQVLDPNNAQLGSVASCSSVPMPACPATPTQLTGLGGSLSTFTVTVQCTLTGDTTEGTRSVRVYQVVATACNQPSGGSCPNTGTPAAGYVERQLTATLSKCRDSTAALPRCSCG
jgi:MSHA biogenesis protein MshO